MNSINKARKYKSPLIDELLKQVTPLEMEQAKLKMQLAAKIEDLIKSKSWSKSEFAEKIGKHPSEITKWLSGTQNFTIDTLIEIAFIFKIKLSDLVIY
ncbi:helix-turn-helix domain-containing protein [Sediminibacterium sp.]|uniref:helix-turn-helix domain-containing protein n=1 Tax=Sediminibacterium sp. TaxID=1917865 RepID=UPI003F71A013